MRIVLMIGFTIVLLPLSGEAKQKRERKLPDQAKSILTKAAQFELYSLEPAEDPKSATKPARLHGWKVLGKLTVKHTDAANKELLTALDKGVSESRGGSKCFDPRHAIHAEYEGKSVDVVICFSCKWVYLYYDGKKEVAAQISISRSAKPLFDKMLSDAKIPLAKKEE